jgi:hypothetical protein
MVFPYILLTIFAVDKPTNMFLTSPCTVTRFTSKTELEGVTFCLGGVQKFECFVYLETFVSSKLMPAIRAPFECIGVVNVGAKTPPTCALASVVSLVVVEDHTFLTNKFQFKGLAWVQDGLEMLFVK